MNVQRCRACHGQGLRPFLDLGATALANSFVPPGAADAPEPAFPLRVVFCAGCGLVQIDVEVPPDVLFKVYIYVSGTSDLVQTHAAWLARHFTGTYGIKPGQLVLEAASNDGTVLKAFARHGLRTVGIEPAANIAERARADGVETVCEFFNAATARAVRAAHGPARLILGRHVLAHVADLHGFVEGLRLVLADDGVAAVEFPHLLPFHDNLEYDTVYHEHLCYFSVRVIRALFARFGLEVIDVREVAIHGGSVVVTAQPAGGPFPVDASVADVLTREAKAGLHEFATWEAYAARVARSKAALLAELEALHSRGQRVAGYGAPAKGMTLLAHCGIGRDRLPYVVDKSPYKQGLLTPGHHIPVYAPEKLLEDQPDVCLILAWNFAPEVVAQQAEYRRRGGRFLVPVPTAHYLDAA